jgi:carbonic anhydrase
VRGLPLPLAALLLTACAVQAGTLCDTGRRQSPVDIRHTRRQPLPPLQFEYRAGPVRLANDGHTLRVRIAPGSHLRIGQQHWALQQFHFHTPGGDRIGGEEFPMAAHLLHKSPSGQLLAVVVLFRIGTENATLAQLLPLVPVHADGDHRVAGDAIRAATLLPQAPGYYRYSGSLTASPCTEGVEWIVLRQPLELSAAQLAGYRSRFADNARAVQALNQRVILETN